MKNGSHKDVRRISAAEICARFDLNRAAHSLLKPDMSVREFAEILIANDQYAGAIDLIAHALSSRHAVWWGCLCLQHSCGQSLTVSEKAACKAAVEWVQEPTEAYRTAAKTPSEMLGSGTPAGALAAAAAAAGAGQESAQGYQGEGMQEQPVAVVEQRVVDEEHQVGRNDPCWCGSGKKFKKCHGA